MRVYVVGIGMGNTLTSEAKEAIKSAQLLIGARRVVDSVCSDVKKVYAIAPTEIANAIDTAKCETVCVLFSGDVGFYSGAKKLYELIEKHEVVAISGISSVQYFCAKLKRPWQDMKLISLHGRKADVVSNVMRNSECFFLTDKDCSPNYICDKLVGYGLGHLQVSVGQRLSYADEKICVGTAAELANKQFDSLCVCIVENDRVAENSGAIDDEAFLRGKVPMTKQEVRTVIISKLCLKYTDVVYDIGGGTGSVSIEMAQIAKRVYSIECNDDAVALMQKNKDKFFAHNLEIVSGKAPDALIGLPEPNAVFVGGSKGNMAEILASVAKKGVKIAISAIAIETLSTAISELSKYCVPEIVCVSVSKGKRVGEYTMMNAYNPIYVISGVVQ